MHFAILLVDIGEFCPMDVVAVVVVVVAVAVVAQGMRAAQSSPAARARSSSASMSARNRAIKEGKKRVRREQWERLLAANPGKPWWKCLPYWWTGRRAEPMGHDFF